MRGNAKKKGNRFEKYLVDVLREQLDCKTHQTVASGAGLDKNDIVLPNYNIEIEAKNKSKFSLTADWRQLKRQKTHSMSVLAIRNPAMAEFKETLIVMELGEFIELVKGKDNAPAVVDLPKNMKWKVKKMKDATNEVFKEFNKII